jgi:hypothetical protein
VLVVIEDVEGCVAGGIVAGGIVVDRIVEVVVGTVAVVAAVVA